MKLLRRFCGLLSLPLAVACERAKTPPPVDSAMVKPAGTADSATATHASTWNASAGPVLLVAGESPSRAFVVVPDTATAAATVAAIPHPADITLFSRSGTVQTAELPALTDNNGACLAADVSAAPPPRPWNIGFIGGVVAPLGMDSIESIAAADSSSLTVWMNRLASALPNDSAGRFNGLQFVLRGLWRFSLPAGPRVVVATLARQINQEATPLQERTFLVAEQSADSSYATAYSERIYGDEETIQNTEVLAGALIGVDRTPTIVVARDFGDANAFGFIERTGNGRWRARWSSARRHCA